VAQRGRPTVITAEVERAIARHGDLSLDALRARLATDGHAVSRAALCRYRKRVATGDAADAPPAVSELAHAADAAVAEAASTGAPAPLLRARDVLNAAMAGWAPKLAKDPRAVRAYVALANRLIVVERAIVECTPVAPESRYAPVEGAALEALLTRAQDAADPGGELAAAKSRIAALMNVLEMRLGGAPT
jgi:hypothetical protein